MEKVEFEAETYKPFRATTSAPKKSWAVQLVMKLSGGRVKNDQQASYVLIVIIILFIAISIYNFSAGKDKTPSKEEIQKRQNQMEEQLRNARSITP